MSLENLGWLLIGAGIGVTLGEENIYIIIFGMIILLTGFAINYQEDKKRRATTINRQRAWRGTAIANHDSKKSKR
jgi:hypothetical protein